MFISERSYFIYDFVAKRLVTLKIICGQNFSLLNQFNSDVAWLQQKKSNDSLWCRCLSIDQSAKIAIYQEKTSVSIYNIVERQNNTEPARGLERQLIHQFSVEDCFDLYMMMLELKPEDYRHFSRRIERMVPFFNLGKKVEFARNFPENLKELKESNDKSGAQEEDP